jgi:phosphoribosylanthranilate isomerase
MRGRKPREITIDEVKQIIDMVADGYSVRYATGIVLGTAHERYIRRIKEQYPDVVQFFDKHKKKRASY